MRLYLARARSSMLRAAPATHAKFLKHHYAVDGIDINENYLLAARLKSPSGNYARADMMDFDLGRSYDIVTCLFSAIGIVKTFERLERAIACMVRHLRPGGVLIIAPWFTPEQWRPARPFILAGEVGADKVYRMSISLKEGQLSLLLHDYLRSNAAQRRALQRAYRIGLVHARRDGLGVRVCRYGSPVRL